MVKICLSRYNFAINTSASFSEIVLRSAIWHGCTASISSSEMVWFVCTEKRGSQKVYWTESEMLCCTYIHHHSTAPVRPIKCEQIYLRRFVGLFQE
jgi:hypothetical protein